MNLTFTAYYSNKNEEDIYLEIIIILKYLIRKALNVKLVFEIIKCTPF